MTNYIYPQLGGSGSGFIGGTIASTQVAFGSGVDTISGSNDLTWDNGAKILFANGSIGIGTSTPAYPLDVNGNTIIRQHFAAGADSNINSGSLIYPANTFSVICSLQEQSTVNNVDFLQAQLGYLELNPLADATYQAYGMDGEVITNPANNNNFPLITGIYGAALHHGGGNIDTVFGVSGFAYTQSVGTIDLMVALEGSVVNSGAGTVNSGAGLRLFANTNNGGGIITNNYGIFLDDQTGVGTNNYNLWSDGTSSLNIFKGIVGIGTATPAHPLDVIGIVGCSDKIDFGTGSGTAVVASNFSVGVDNAQVLVANFANGSGFHVRGNGIDTAKFRQQQTCELVQTIRSGGGAAWVLKGTGAAHTALTASTENNDVYFNLNRTVQFATGALTIERAFLIDPNVTYGFVGASSITDAVGFAVRGLPLQGTNATISRSTGAMFGDYGITGNSSNNFEVTILQPGINTGVGSVSTQAGMIIWNPLPVSLGNQTATVTDLANAYFGSIAYSSTTNVRTVTRGSNVYIQGPPSSSGNVTFTGTGGPFSLFVDSGASRFDGIVLGSSGAITAANDLPISNSNLQTVSGNTQINGIATTVTSGPSITAGTIIQLLFSGTPTIKHNTAPSAGFAKIFLAGSVDLVAAANTVLSVVYDGTQWQEISRKAA